MLVVCTGTGTDVGKTWIGASVLHDLRSRGNTVAARKPVQSYDPHSDHPTDAEVLAGATGETPTSVCPPQRWLEAPMAPPMAAEALARPAFTIAELVSELRWPQPTPDLTWIETAGGVRSPMAADGDTVDLCHAVRPDKVILVADPGLGTINAVRLSVAALRPWPVIVVLNRYDDHNSLHNRNRSWLAERDTLDVATDPAELASRLQAAVRSARQRE
jgi:dethiobiotin synthetase